MLHFARPPRQSRRQNRKPCWQSKWKPPRSMHSPAPQENKFSALPTLPTPWHRTNKTSKRAKRTELTTLCEFSRQWSRINLGECLRSALSRRNLALAADQLAELVEALLQAAAGKRREFAFEREHKLALLHPHRGARQDPRHRGGSEIGDAHRPAENAGTLQEPFRGKFAQPVGRLLLPPDVAVEHREREKRPAGMVDAGEGGIGDDVERLLAAIIGMRAPADIGEQASSVAQPFLLGGLLDLDRLQEAVGPAD